MLIGELKALQWDGPSIAILAGLPPPGKSPHQGATLEDLLHLTQRFLYLWAQLLSQADLPVTEAQGTDIEEQPCAYQGEDLWARLILSVSSYYSDTTQRALSLRTETSPLPSGFGKEDITGFLDIAAAAPSEERQRQAVIAAQYIMGQQGAYHAWSYRHKIGDTSLAVFQRVYLQCLDAMYVLQRPPQHELLDLAVHKLLSTLFRLQSLVLPTDPSPSDQQTSFSAIRASELPLFASRASIVLSRYGEARCAKLFEQRLSLLFQSLGLQVIPTVTGKSTVDLICIGVADRVSFFVEAKSTRGRYALPTKDSRAIMEYVKEAPKVLGALPALSFVLIVGPAASKTLPAKLKSLEVKIGLPVRFIEAKTLAELRNKLLGSLPTQVFADLVGRSEAIVDEAVVSSLADHEKEERDAYSGFIKKLADIRKR